LEGPLDLVVSTVNCLPQIMCFPWLLYSQAIVSFSRHFAFITSAPSKKILAAPLAVSIRLICRQSLLSQSYSSDGEILLSRFRKKQSLTCSFDISASCIYSRHCAKSFVRLLCLFSLVRNFYLSHPTQNRMEILMAD